VGLDLFERAESEPLVESASPPVDMEDAKSERLSHPACLLHKPANDRRADAPSLPSRQELDLGEADGAVFLLDDKQPDVLILRLDDVPALGVETTSEILACSPSSQPQTRSTYSRMAASWRADRKS
jgi:hypothetical protein